MTSVRPREPVVRGAVASLALAAMLIAQSPPSASALGMGGHGGDKSDACAAERAPILERKRQYDALHRSQIVAALGQGVERALFRTGDVHFGLSGTCVSVRPASIIQTRGVTSGLGRISASGPQAVNTFSDINSPNR